MGEVATLQHEEAVCLQPEALAALYRDLGPMAADEVVARAVEEIALRVEGLSAPHVSGQWLELARRARALKAIAEQVGMATLAAVAADVANCAMRCEAPALGATLARLERTAYRSLAELWDIKVTGG